MRLVDAAGKPVSLEDIDPKLATVLESAFGGITHQMSAATNATLKPLQESIAGLTEKIESLPKADPNSESNTGNEKQTGTESGGDPASKALLEEFKKLNERLDGIESESKADKQAKTSRQITEAYFAANHPTMKGKDALIARIASGNPEDEDAVKAAVEAERKLMAELQGEEAVAKVFSASMEDEGGKKAENDDKEAEAKKKIEAMEAELPKPG